jgi:putative ABC transport system ATP-binding protein
MMGTVIKTNKVTKVFNPDMPDEIKAVTDISIEIKRGEIAVLKGPSGSGKTTLLSLIGCMSRPTEGFNLIRGISVIENVMLPLYPTNIKISDIKRRAEIILENLGISNKKGSKVQRLSGGEQQRVAIARALINEPEIILADEPTAHLDTKLSEDLMQIFSTLQKEGKTIIIATHDPLIHEREVVNRLIEMRDGMVKTVIRKTE